MTMERDKDAVYLIKDFAGEPLTLAFLERVVSWTLDEVSINNNNGFDEVREDRRAGFAHTFPLDTDKILAALKTLVSSCQQ